jgi:hypothetical protein
VADQFQQPASHAVIMFAVELCDQCVDVVGCHVT